MKSTKFSTFDTEVFSIEGTKKKVSEIIDIDSHTWSIDDNIIIKHEGILLLRKFTGATFLPIRLISEPTQFNNNGYVFECSVQFPDGEISTEIGEASNINTDGFSQKYKPSMAFKRGYDRAFLRSNYIGLFEVYSEEESDDFKESHSIQYSHKQNELYLNFPDRNLLTLPDTDEKYPNQNIVEDVTKIHKDFTYLSKIIKNYPNNANFRIASEYILKVRDGKMRTSDSKEPSDSQVLSGKNIEENNQVQTFLANSSELEELSDYVENATTDRQLNDDKASTNGVPESTSSLASDLKEEHQTDEINP